MTRVWLYQKILSDIRFGTFLLNKVKPRDGVWLVVRCTSHDNVLKFQLRDVYCMCRIEAVSFYICTVVYSALNYKILTLSDLNAVSQHKTCYICASYVKPQVCKNRKCKIFYLLPFSSHSGSIAWLNLRHIIIGRWRHIFSEKRNSTTVKVNASRDKELFELHILLGKRVKMKIDVACSRDLNVVQRLKFKFLRIWTPKHDIFHVR